MSELASLFNPSSVALVGARKREINIYLDPAAMESLGVGADQEIGRAHV